MSEDAALLLPSAEGEDALASRTVLVVDDDRGVRDLVCRWLDAGGYRATPAGDAEQALGLLHAAAPAVALCDIRMPGHDGLWLADRIRHGHPDTAVIMATGVQDVGAAVESLRQGVVDYLTKPFGRDRLREAVWRGIEWHRAALDSRRWRESLEGEARTRHARLSSAIAALRLDSDEALDAMLSMLTMSDRDAYAHAYRVAALSVSMARSLGLADAEVATVERGAMLHDLGKLAMPEALLRKPAPLTTEEQVLVRMHPALGSRLIENIPYLAKAAAVVRDAHERVDGLGYPRGLRGEDVWIGARIVCVADAYDTMTRPRVFRDAITPIEALLELDRCADSQFDGRAVAALKRVLAVH
jgi:putative nucleotidyltransferase with HDIG domain